MAIAYIALGSNLQQPPRQVQSAINTLSKISSIMVLAVSPFYRSIPLGSADQPDFLNAVMKVYTQLSPERLLDILQNIELTQGRKRTKEKFAARVLDLDILLYDDLIINSTRLTIPHYDLENRAFVLYPLFDIEPTLLLPNGQSLAMILNNLKKDGIEDWTD